MAATTYSTLPSNAYGTFQTKNDPFRTGSHETYGSNIESVTSHPFPSTHGQFDQLPLASNPQFHSQPFQTMPTNTQMTTQNYSERTLPSINPRDPTYMTMKPYAPPPPPAVPAAAPVPAKPTETSLVRSERQITNQPKGPSTINPKTNANGHRLSSPSVGARQRSPSNPNNRHGSEPTTKTTAPARELKPNKSSLMRAAAIKKIEAKREQKRQDAFFPSSENKSRSKAVQSTPETDIDHHVLPKKKALIPAQPVTDADESEPEKTPIDKKGSKPKIKTRKVLPPPPPPRPPPVEQNEKKSKKKAPAPVAATVHRHSDDEHSETEKPKPKKKGTKGQKNPPPPPDTDHSDDEKPKSNKKNPSKSKARQSRRSNYQTDRSQSSDDDGHRSKSRKRKTQLPSIHRAPGPPFGHPALHPYYDDYPYYPLRYDHRYRHLHEDAADVPPYLAPYHDPYDPFFDYEKRKSQAKHRKDKNHSRTDHEDNGAATGYDTEREEGAKSKQSRKSRNKNPTSTHVSGRKSRPPYRPGDFIEEPDVLDLWRQERNDYLKKKFKPTVHDVLYSQQWAKADSYVENQRRRALRDSQGFYFPYKRYTLKDYKDLQKSNMQNLYGDSNDPVMDRKERANRRQEYGMMVERQVADNPGARHITPRDMPPREPWHVSAAEPNEPEKPSKRDRALEYAKVQVKYRPVDPGRHISSQNEDGPYSDRHHYRDTNGNSPNEGHSRVNQSYDDYYD